MKHDHWVPLLAGICKVLVFLLLTVVFYLILCYLAIEIIYMLPLRMDVSLAFEWAAGFIILFLSPCLAYLLLSHLK